jgi:hypothetical protein
LAFYLRAQGRYAYVKGAFAIAKLAIQSIFSVVFRNKGKLSVAGHWELMIKQD